MQKQTKCVSIQLSIGQFEQLNAIKKLTGKSQNTILVESILAGLKKFEKAERQLYLVKVRIDPSKMMAFGEKLQSGKLKTNMIKFTYCINNDPTVGVSLWEAKNEEEFFDSFNPHKEYYKDVIEIVKVIEPEEAMNMILETMN